MLNILRLDQDFGWRGFSSFNIVDDPTKFVTLPSPKIVLMNDNKWFDYDRANVDACVFWTSESLAFERANGNPIVKLNEKDLIYSSSIGPNNNCNLLYWVQSFSNFYRRLRYKKFIPKNEIFNNGMLSTLGNSKLHRCYIFCKLVEENLFNRNISLGYGLKEYHILPDKNKEIKDQQKIYDYLQLNDKLLPSDALKLELDWRLLKKMSNYYDMRYTHLFPTNAYLDSSLIYICETIVYNKEFFVTEKTLKGLISGRPCIIIGCQHFLKNLKELGFKTYSEVLDESYDDLESLKDRVDLSIEIAKDYIESNILNYPKKLLKIQEITNHNLQVLFNTDWSKNMQQAMFNICNTLGVDVNK